VWVERWVNGSGQVCKGEEKVRGNACEEEAEKRVKKACFIQDSVVRICKTSDHCISDMSDRDVKWRDIPPVPDLGRDEAVVTKGREMIMMQCARRGMDA
jgi:hypothetical protein